MNTENIETISDIFIRELENSKEHERLVVFEEFYNYINEICFNCLDSLLNKSFPFSDHHSS